jgi:hypothetical protein
VQVHLAMPVEQHLEWDTDKSCSLPPIPATRSARRRRQRTFPGAA